MVHEPLCHITLQYLCKYCCIYNKEVLSYHLVCLFLSLCFIIIIIIAIVISMMVLVWLKHDHSLKSEWQKILGGAAHNRVIFLRLAFINNWSFLESFFSEYIWLLNNGPILKGINASVSTDNRVYAVGSDGKRPDLRPVSLRGGTGMRPRDRNTGSKSTVERPASPGFGTGPTSKLPASPCPISDRWALMQHWT